MAKRKKTKSKSPKRPPKPGWWASLDAQRRARVVRRTLFMILIAAVSVAGAGAMERLEAHVDHMLLRERPTSTLTFLDLPAEIARELNIEENRCNGHES